MREIRTSGSAGGLGGQPPGLPDRLTRNGAWGLWCRRKLIAQFFGGLMKASEPTLMVSCLLSSLTHIDVFGAVPEHPIDQDGEFASHGENGDAAVLRPGQAAILGAER